MTKQEITTLRERGFEKETIRQMIWLEMEEYLNGCDYGAPDYEEGPQGWIEYHSGYVE